MIRQTLAFVGVAGLAVAAAYAAPLPLPDYTYPGHLCDRELIATQINHIIGQMPTDYFRFGKVVYVISTEELSRSKDELRCRVIVRTSTTERLPGIFRWINEDGMALVRYDWNEGAAS